MKMIKRIFITLLILALTVSVLAFSAFAAESDSTDFGYVLEYFEEPTLFNYDFTKGEVDYSSSLIVKRPGNLTQSIVADEENPGNGYLSLAVASSTGFIDAYTDNNVYFSWNGAEAVDDFILKMTVSANKGEGKESSLPIIVVSVADEECTDASMGAEFGTTVVAIDYKENCIRYVDNATGEAKSVPFALDESAWYNVTVVHAADGATSITVTAVSDVTNTYTVEDASIPYTAIKNVRIGAHGTYYGTPRGTVMNFADIVAFGGKFDRNPSLKQRAVEDAITEMYDAFISEEITVDEQTAICEIATKIVGYGFTSENADVTDYLAELGKGVVPFYNDKLIYCIDTFATLVTYPEQRALVDQTLVYANALRNFDLTGNTDEYIAEINENINAVDQLDKTLVDIEYYTLEFVAAVNEIGEVDLYHYPTVQSLYTQLAVHTFDPTYEGIEKQYQTYLDIVNAYNSIVKKGTAFINAVESANADGIDFNTKAAAFTLAKNSYYDNESYPGITEAIATYNALYEYMNSEIEKAEKFIAAVKSADYADYVTAKQEFLDEASKYADCQPEYQGVAEAKLLMVEVQAFIDVQIKNATAYIDAVSALDYLRGDELMAGIKKAQDLQKAGNVLGVSGVTEANIKLNQVISSMELEVKYRDHFIGLVDAIDNTTDPKALFALLIEAKDAEGYANPRAEGVFEASTKLEKAIANYNKKANDANKAFATASEAAIYTCAIGKDVNPVADRVVALIKKFFDEE